jgi:putative ATPase
LADVADGDARQALNGLELALKVCDTPSYRQATLSRSTSKDGGGAEVEAEVDPLERKKRDGELMDAVRREERYDMISALHKCLRGSDGSAAMYWLAR